MNPHRVDFSYSVQVWTAEPTGQRGWKMYGQRRTIDGARSRRDELRRRFTRVRIVEHKMTATVVV